MNCDVQHPEEKMSFVNGYLSTEDAENTILALLAHKGSGVYSTNTEYETFVESLK